MTAEEWIAQRAKRAVEEKVFSGCVVGIIKNNERTIFPFGHLTYEENSPHVEENTIYDLASITKSIPVASLALTFIEASRLNLDDKVVEYIPELRNDFGATIEDLLRYRVRGPRLSILKDESADEILAYVFEHGFDGPPGESEYSNLPAFLLAIVIERAGGEMLPALAHKYFFEPLKMNDASFLPRFDLGKDAVAPTEVIDGVEIRGIVHDESARVFAKEGKVVGHAGLFSTAPDLLTFLNFLLHGRGPASAISAGAKAGLGWELNQKWMGRHAATLFGKSGFTGTAVMCNIELETALVILSNRTYPHRPTDSSAIHSFRADVADIVFHHG